MQPTVPQPRADAPAPRRSCAHPWHSVSSTSDYERCPRRYAYGYLERRAPDRPVPTAWRFGSVVHAGLEVAYKLMADEPDLPRRHVLDAANDAVAHHWDALDLDDPSGCDRAQWLVGRAVTLDPLRIGSIRGVEIALRGRIDDVEQIVGFADLILDRGNGVIEVVDHKVTRRMSTEEQLRDDRQLNLYGQLARSMWPDVAVVLASHHYPLLAKVVTVELKRATMRSAERSIVDIAACIRADEAFLPSPGDHCRHCPWQPSCPEGLPDS